MARGVKPFQIAGVVSLLTDATTIAVNMQLADNFSVTLGGNRVLGAPTNVVAGKNGTIAVTQDAIGSRTLAFDPAWKFSSGVPPTLTTTPGAIDVLSYYVQPDSTLMLSVIADARSVYDYVAARSLRFNSADSSYLSRTPGVAGNQQTLTVSFWMKRSVLGSPSQYIFSSGNDGVGLILSSVGVDTLEGFLFNTGQTFQTSRLFRDPSAWYHIVVAIDTPQATAANRVKLYVNGVQETAFASVSYPAQNANSVYNGATVHRISSYNGSSLMFNGYLSDVYLIDGQALTPSSFAYADPTTGQWMPKRYSGAFGTCGCWLDFSDSSSTTALGLDKSNSGNNWTTSGFSVTAGVTNDSLADSPTNNYCTLNYLNRYIEYGSFSTTNGALDTTGAGTDFAMVLGTLGVNTGKWYFEGTLTSAYGVGASHIGIAPTTFRMSGYSSGSGPSMNQAPANGAAYDGRAYLYINGGAPGFGATYTTNDIIGCAFDADTGKVWFRKNGVWQGTGSPDPATGTAPATTLVTGDTWTPIFGGYSTGSWATNFGQRTFAYTAPSGFLSLCTTNLTTPGIITPSQYMDVVTYTGSNASTTQVVTGLNFQPDLAWIKERSVARSHVWSDSARGANKSLSSDWNGAEETDQVNGHVNSLDLNGFTLHDGTTSGPNVKDNGQTYVAWSWKKGATPGFDIIAYTGTGSSHTVNHSLGVIPEFMIAKNRSTAAMAWLVYHKQMAASSPHDWYMTLNGTAAASNGADVWSAEPTNSQFSVNNNDENNKNGDLIIIYLFAGVPGFSKFGSYIGNGSADGSFVYLGFRPRWLLLRNTAVIDNWYLWDTSRDPYNMEINYLLANSAQQETTNPGLNQLDVVSNGFKIRGTHAGMNGSSNTLIYAAFAESPFKYSRAR